MRTSLVPRTPVLVRVLQTLQMSISGGIAHVHRPKDTRARARTSNTPTVHSWRHSARPLVPRTPVLVRVLQTLQMSILGGILARLLVPITPLLVRVLQTLQISILGGKRARPLVPRRLVLVRELSNILGPLHARSPHARPRKTIDRNPHRLPLHNPTRDGRKYGPNRRRRVSNLSKTTAPCPHPTHRYDALLAFLDECVVEVLAPPRRLLELPPRIRVRHPARRAVARVASSRLVSSRLGVSEPNRRDWTVGQSGIEIQ